MISVRLRMFIFKSDMSYIPSLPVRILPPLLAVASMMCTLWKPCFSNFWAAPIPEMPHPIINIWESRAERSAIVSILFVHGPITLMDDQSIWGSYEDFSSTLLPALHCVTETLDSIILRKYDCLHNSSLLRYWKG